jgi:hypothetical protein
MVEERVKRASQSAAGAKDSSPGREPGDRIALRTKPVKRAAEKVRQNSANCVAPSGLKVND